MLMVELRKDYHIGKRNLIRHVCVFVISESIKYNSWRFTTVMLVLSGSHDRGCDGGMFQILG